MSEFEKELRNAVKAVKKAGELVHKLQYMQLKWHVKEAKDFATRADLFAQKLIEKTLEKTGYGFVGEESLSRSDWRFGKVWLVDPIDGTANYALGLPWYCVSIALAQHGEPVLGVVYKPASGELFTAVKHGGAFLNGKRIRVSPKRLEELVLGFSVSHKLELTLRVAKQLPFLQPLALRLRSIGSTADEACNVACGKFGAYYNLISTPWDFAACKVIVEEAGGVSSDLRGKPWALDSKNILVANNKRSQRLLVEAIARAEKT